MTDAIALERLPRRALLARAVILVVSFHPLVSRAAAQIARDQKFPDITGVAVNPRGNDTFDFDVTVSSPYDTPQRYADAFRVLGPDGKTLGERILFHDHQDEQPFTRDLYGVKIPPGITRVVVEGRDQTFGWGGRTFAQVLPGR